MFQTSQYTYAVSGSGEYILLVGGHHNSMETLSIDNTVPPKYAALPVSDLSGSRAAVVNDTIFTVGGGRSDDDMKRCFRTKSGLEWNEAPDLKVSVE